MAKSILSDLTKFKVGDIKYIVMLRLIGESVKIDKKKEYLRDCHPKIWFKHLDVNHLWPYDGPLPKIHALDASVFAALLASELVVEKFNILEFRRCMDSGEFLYFNGKDWMAESCLFDSEIEANTERSRIKKLVNHWAINNMIAREPEIDV